MRLAPSENDLLLFILKFIGFENIGLSSCLSIIFVANLGLEQTELLGLYI
jgi:hypothetical protein